VKSFPTLGYWFSVIPIIPILGRLFEQAACIVLPDLFRKYKSPPEREGKSYAKTSDLYTALNFLAGSDFETMFREKISQVTTGQKLAADWAVNRAEQPVERSRQKVLHSDVVGRPVDVAARQMQDARINVTRVQPYDPRRGAGNLIKFTQAPPVINPGTNITLYEENGIVRYYAVEDDAVVLAQKVGTEVETQKSAMIEVQALQGQLQQLQATLADRDKELNALRTQVRTLAKPPTSAETKQTTDRVVELENQLSELQKFQQQVTEFMSKSSGTGGTSRRKATKKSG
jgi:hypothetical protein